MDLQHVYYKLHAHIPRRFGQLDPRRYLEVYIEKLMEVDKPSLFEEIEHNQHVCCKKLTCSYSGRASKLKLKMQDKDSDFYTTKEFDIEKMDSMTLPEGRTVNLPICTKKITLLTTMTTDIQSDKPLLINEELEFSSFEEGPQESTKPATEHEDTTTPAPEGTWHATEHTDRSVP